MPVRAAFAAVCLLAVFAIAMADARERTIAVYAAASMRNAIDDINAAYTKTTGVRVVANYASSPALAKQIEAGAPADLFISADLDWMDHLEAGKHIKPGTRVNLLGNRLVLIAPNDAKRDAVDIKPGVDLARLAGGGRIALGDVRAVPAGKYAKAALLALGEWSAVEKKLAMTENVRVALALVARGEAPLGIVYQSDAMSEKQVKIIGYFPRDSHPPIVYPAALTAGAAPAAGPYFDFLRTGAAKALFEKHGLEFLIRPAS